MIIWWGIKNWIKSWFGRRPLDADLSDDLRAVRERVTSVRVMQGGVGIRTFLIIIAAGFALYFLGSCNAKAKRDQWWREQIAAKSEVIRKKIETENDDLTNLDNEIIETIGEYDARLKKAQENLSRPDDNDPSCRPLPIRCFGVQ